MCCVQGVIVRVVGGCVSARSSWMIVAVVSGRSQGRGGVCTSTVVLDDGWNSTLHTVSTLCWSSKSIQNILPESVEPTRLPCIDLNSSLEPDGHLPDLCEHSTCYRKVESVRCRVLHCREPRMG